MVILETAAVGAAGYGIYRGGEESAKKAKQAKKEYQFGQKLRGNRKELSSKNKDRSERIAQINMMRNNRRNDSASSSITNESNTNAWPLGGATTSTRSTATNNTSDVEDRQKAVMEKLSKNKSKPKSSMFGMFKKKK